jgi:hypothetical protein
MTDAFHLEALRTIYVPQPKLEARRGYLRVYSARSSGLVGRAPGTQHVKPAKAHATREFSQPQLLGVQVYSG